MKVFSELWNNRSNPKGRIDITFFFINLFLLLCHIIIMGVYIVIGHKCMIFINCLSILIYLTQIYSCFRKPNVYVPLTFFEIWFHMIFAVLSFGWNPCFQNWTFALITAYFLPAYSSDYEKSTKLQAIIFTSIIVITYFVLSILINVINIPIAVILDDIPCKIMFVLNNLFTFITITLFAIFYTNSSKKKEIELIKKADYDELTEIYNRYAITQISKNTSGKYNVAIIDIDHFKKVNDKYGHTSGDIVLKEIANILKNHDYDLIPSRWGGEEFVILSTNNISYDTFKKIMEELRIKIKDYKFRVENNKEIRVTISIGTSYVDDSKNFSEALKIADSNLYIAKESVRNKLIG